MSRALTRARERYEATPRKLDEDEAMTRLARGDRGCLGDLLSGLGAVTLMALLILAGLGRVGFSWVYVGVALFVGGFITGTVAQVRSGRVRRAALEGGPLALGVVMSAPDHLGRPGKKVGRAVILLAPRGELRFDREWLEGATAHLRPLLESKASGELAPLAALLTDPEQFALLPVPAPHLPAPQPEGVYIASVFVHPEHLPGAYLGAEEDEAAEAAGADLDAPARPATLAVIVDPESGFVEQVPGVFGETGETGETGEAGGG